jgi:membrane glycosyltransferase
MDQPDHTLTAAAGTRSPLREERHPNSVTAPPLNRGSMAPRPWRGFWNSMATAVLLPMLTLFKAADPAALRPLPSPRPEPWQRAAKRRRAVFLLLTLVSTVLATSIFADMQPDYDNAWLQYGQITLFALLSAWVVTGFMTAMMGFYVTIYGDKHALSSKKSSMSRWTRLRAPPSSCRSATRTCAPCSPACAPPASRSR